jgi:CubicO group peptidase (beta-lactamase class C family)
LTVIFSSGKVIESILTVQQISAGRLGWDQKIASIWPEFATGNKENVTVKDLLEHQGGVAGMDKGFNPNLEEARDLDKLAAKIARQPHNSGGKLAKSYHALTRGWYTNELGRRADPKRRSQGTILREEINPRLGIEIYTGLPPSLHDRVSKVVMHPLHMSPPPRSPPTTIDRNTIIPDIADFTRAMVKTGVTGLKDLIREPKNEGNYANSKAVQECETPSAFTVTNAFSMAKLASVMSRKGEGWLMDEKTWKEAHTIETRNLGGFSWSFQPRFSV